LLFALHTQRQSDLRDQSHREFVNCPLQFNKRSQLFIGTHDETHSVIAMRVCNPDRSPASMIPLSKCRAIRHNSRRAAFYRTLGRSFRLCTVSFACSDAGFDGAYRMLHAYEVRPRKGHRGVDLISMCRTPLG
jgi:hypothetical protein